MSKLPEPIWIFLQETLALVLDRTGADPEKAKQSLVEAFIEEEIETTGDSQSKSIYAAPPGTRLSGSIWHSADVSWVDSVLNPQFVGPDVERWERGMTWADEASGYSHRIDRVRVRRKDVVRWLGADGAPAGEDEEPAASEAGPGTGGKNRRKPSDDAVLKNRIERVLAQARRKWPDRLSRPTPYTMAKTMCNAKVGGKIEGYSEHTVKKILGGTYPAIARLNISPLN